MTGYIVGRPFQTSEGWAEPGEPAPEEAVESTNLYALISAGFLYPVEEDQGYDALPPHVYTAVRTYQEIQGIIAVGEEPIAMSWEPPAKLIAAQEMVDAEAQSIEDNAKAKQEATDAWTRKVEVNQISPRPLELPREELFVDAKKAEAEAAAADVEVKPLHEWTKAKLIAEAKARGLSTEGTKADLLARLEG